MIGRTAARKGRAMSDREPSVEQESRLRRVRPSSAEPAQDSGVEEDPRRPEGEDPLEKVRSVGRRIAEGFRGGAGGQGTSDQIRELARLRDEGHISSAEFEAKKRELLERM
jgi:hypothetical protein